jgi:hypothetical protein
MVKADIATPPPPITMVLDEAMAMEILPTLMAPVLRIAMI